MKVLVLAVVLTSIPFVSSVASSNAFSCNFENDVCGFELVEPADFTDGDAFYWHQRQDVTLSNGVSFSDHTLGPKSKDGVLLFANGGRPNALTVLETSSAINCSSKLCCFSVFVLMSQSESPDDPGSLAIRIVQNSFTDQQITTIIANVTFSSVNWINLQHTFYPNSQPFQIGLDARNGGGGRSFFVAVDDLSVKSGICDVDVASFGSHSSRGCGRPPEVVGGRSTVSLISDSPGVEQKVTYKCMPGFDLVGPSVSTCLLNGRWSTVPVCVPRRPARQTHKRVFQPASLSSSLMSEERPPSSAILSKPQRMEVSDCYWGQYYDQSGDFSSLKVTDAKLYLFPKDPIQCTGQVFQWNLIVASSPDYTPVYLSVWRPSGNQFKLIGINQFTTKRWQSAVEFVVPSDQRLDVVAGDVIGIIHKRTSVRGVIRAYDANHLPTTGGNLFNAVSSQLDIEDLTIGQAVTVDSHRQEKILPLLQAFVGKENCTENVFREVSFSGLFTVIPVNSREECWQKCRNEPNCNAISYHSVRRDCHYYSYISDEVHFTPEMDSLIRACYDDCGIKLLSDGGKVHDTESLVAGVEVAEGDRAFDVAILGPEIDMNTVPTSESDCELVCRYTPSCVGFSYSLPFEEGTCQIFSEITEVQRRDTGIRSFRKWGCQNVRLTVDCQPCTSDYQCNPESVCLPTFGNGSSSVCVPRGRASACRKQPLTSQECPDPPQIQFGYLENYDFSSPTPTATYACNAGYEFVTNQQINCVNSQWQLPLPACRPMCPTLPTVNHGRVELVPTGSANPTKQAAVQCDDGYRQVGSSMIVCLTPFNWSSVPSCVANCGSPPNVTNGNWVVVEGTQTQPTVVRFSCNDGFTLNGSETLRCSDNLKTWSTPPLCKSVAGCPTPPPLVNGMALGVGPIGIDSIISYATYACLPGYELSGNSTIYCQLVNGSYQWQQLASCTASCGAIPNVPNSRARVLDQRGGQATIVAFDCLDAFEMDGDSVVSCISSLWTRSPTCRKGTKTNYCGQPPGIDYGIWHPILQLGAFPLSVEYSCLTGYSLLGPVRLVCDDSGSNGQPSWKPALTPSCQPFFDSMLFQLPQLETPNMGINFPIANNIEFSSSRNNFISPPLAQLPFAFVNTGSIRRLEPTTTSTTLDLAGVVAQQRYAVGTIVQPGVAQPTIFQPGFIQGVSLNAPSQVMYSPSSIGTSSSALNVPGNAAFVGASSSSNIGQNSASVLLGRGMNINSNNNQGLFWPFNFFNIASPLRVDRSQGTAPLGSQLVNNQFQTGSYYSTGFQPFFNNNNNNNFFRFLNPNNNNNFGPSV